LPLQVRVHVFVIAEQVADAPGTLQVWTSPPCEATQV
jgi:hypothetical protein